MKKINLVILITTLLLAFGFTATQAAAPAALWISAEDDPRPMLVVNEKFKLSPVIQHIQSLAHHYTIDARYPQITGAALNDPALHFNQLVETTIQKQIETFKQNLANAAQNNEALPKTDSYLKINYEMAAFTSQSQQTEFVSIRFNTEGYERGMAHPYHLTTTLTYDLGHDQTLTLADLFKPEVNGLSTIAKHCIQYLQAKKLPNLMLQQGAEASAQNYKNWNLTLSGLLITFDPAQVAPAYMGMQQVLIPQSTLAPLLTHQVACTIGIVLCDKT